mgnify:CR=1 FL=1
MLLLIYTGTLVSRDVAGISCGFSGSFCSLGLIACYWPNLPIA